MNTDSLWKKIKLSLTNVQIIHGNQCFNIGLERPIKLEADKEYEICLIIDQDISTLYINGNGINARLCDHPGNGLALTVTDGTLEAKNTKIATKINK